MEDTRSQFRYAAAVCAAGAVLLGTCIALALLSARFDYGSPMETRPLRALVALLMAAGLIYLGAVAALTRLHGRALWLGLVVAFGLAMRVPLFFSQPIQEDDFYRYLWDGGVAAHAVNPYGIVPADVHSAQPSGDGSQLQRLADQSGRVVQRINHPELATVYPPTAQAAFALAHVLRPWNLTAWRLVLFAFDAATLALLIVLLRSLDRPLHFAAIYWWNPVLLKEAYNSAHMDLVALPFVLAALWFALRSRPARAAATWALAVGTKLWPVLLAPLLLRALPAQRPARRAVALGTGLAVLLVVMTPLLAAVPLGAQSGFAAYCDRWEMNDALFMILHRAAGDVSDAIGLTPPWPERIARAAALAIVLAVLAWLTRKPIAGGLDLASRSLIVLGVAFMLSPTQFPWYYLWLLPFLALSPRPSLLVLTAMLPMYYLKFFYDARGNVELFHNGLVWVEYAPTLALAAWEALPVQRLWAPKPA